MPVKRIYSHANMDAEMPPAKQPKLPPQVQLYKQDICEDALRLIFSFLNPQDLCRLELTCKYFRHLSHYTWRELTTKFGVSEWSENKNKPNRDKCNYLYEKILRQSFLDPIIDPIPTIQNYLSLDSLSFTPNPDLIRMLRWEVTTAPERKNLANKMEIQFKNLNKFSKTLDAYIRWCISSLKQPVRGKLPDWFRKHSCPLPFESNPGLKIAQYGSGDHILSAVIHHTFYMMTGIERQESDEQVDKPILAAQKAGAVYANCVLFHIDRWRRDHLLEEELALMKQSAIDVANKDRMISLNFFLNCLADNRFTTAKELYEKGIHYAPILTLCGLKEEDIYRKENLLEEASKQIKKTFGGHPTALNMLMQVKLDIAKKEGIETEASQNRLNFITKYYLAKVHAEALDLKFHSICLEALFLLGDYHKGLQLLSQVSDSYAQQIRTRQCAAIPTVCRHLHDCFRSFHSFFYTDRFKYALIVDENLSNLHGLAYKYSLSYLSNTQGLEAFHPCPEDLTRISLFLQGLFADSSLKSANLLHEVSIELLNKGCLSEQEAHLYLYATFGNRNYQAALDFAEERLKKNPSDLLMREAAAMACFKLARFENAALYFESLLNLGKLSEALISPLLYTWIQVGKSQQSYDLFRQQPLEYQKNFLFITIITIKNANSINVATLKGWLQIGKFEEISALIKQYASDKPTQASLLSSLRQEARAILSHHSLDLLLDSATDLAKDKKLGEAKELYEKAIALYRDKIPLKHLYSFAYIHFKLNEHEKAALIFEHCLNHSASSESQGYEQLQYDIKAALCFAYTNRSEKAKNLLIKINTICHRSLLLPVHMLSDWTESCYLVGDYETADRLYSQIDNLTNGLLSGVDLGNWALVKASLGKHEDTKKLMMRAKLVQLNKEKPDPFFESLEATEQVSLQIGLEAAQNHGHG